MWSTLFEHRINLAAFAGVSALPTLTAGHLTIILQIFLAALALGSEILKRIKKSKNL